MSTKETYDKIVAHVQKEIAAGGSWDLNTRVLEYCEKYETEKGMVGLVTYHGEQSSFGGGWTGGTLPPAAEEHFNLLVANNDKFTIDALTGLFWSCYNSDYCKDFKGDEKIDEAIMAAQNTAAYKSTSPTAGYNFTVFAVTPAELRNRNKFVQIEGEEEGRKRKEVVQEWSSNAYGWFTQTKAENPISAWGTLIGSGKEAAESVAQLEPHTVYNGDFGGTFKTDRKSFLLYQNGAVTWNALSDEPVDPKVVAAWAAENPTLIDAAEFGEWRPEGNGEARIIKCKVENIGKTATTKTGKAFGQVVIGPATKSANPTTTNVTFFDNAYLSSMYGKGSTILIGAYIKRGDDERYPLNITGQWIVPVRVINQQAHPLPPV